MRPKLIGLTGNIGSGKSSVARMLAKKGAAIIDADMLARAATQDPVVLTAIAEQLGSELVQNGQLDRKRTAELVFQNPAARIKLNQIIHPWVREKSAEQVEQFSKSLNPPPLIVQDIPLLFESGLEKNFDAVVVVYAPLDQRIARVMSRNQLSEAEIRARDTAQMGLEEKVKRANVVIDNSNDLEHLQKQVDTFWNDFVT